MRPGLKLKISPLKMGFLVVLAACLIFYSFGAQKPDLLTSLDNRITDAMFRWRGPMKTTESVVIVDIDEKSLKYAGQWPWPRNIVARLVQKINAAGPRVIAFDIVFAEGDRTSPIQYVDELQQIFKVQLPDVKQLVDNEMLNYDIALGNAVANAPTVLGYVFQLKNDGLKEPEEAPFPSGRIKIVPESTRFGDLDLISAYRAIVNISDVARGKSEGFFNVLPDPAGTVRKVPLLMGLDHIPYPSLAMEAFRIGQQQQELTIHVPPERITPPIDVLGISVGDRFIPTDERVQLAVNFRGPGNMFEYVSAADVLQDLHQKSLENKYVLIGSSASGLFDLVATPFSSSFAGVEVHATVIDNMIAGDPFAHDIFTEIGLTYALVVVGGIVLSLLLVYTGPLSGGLGGLAIILAAVAGNYHFFFLENVLVGVTYPFLSLIAVFIVVTVFNYFYEGREKSFIRNAFGHYVSPQLVNQLISSPDKLSLKGEQKNLTVLFSDIRGFTTISEQMSSEQLGLFMNEYLSTMSHIIRAHSGTLDKFIGDAIMAIWGAPIDDEDHAAKAVRASIEMMNQLKASQADFAARGLPVIEIGIGINTGMVSVGNFGSRERFDYTVMGDNVNLASRLEGLNKDYGPNIIISEFTKTALGDRFFCRIVDKVQVKGKNKAVVIYEPLVEGEPDEALRREVEVFEDAVGAYQTRKFEQAYDIIEALYRENPLRLYAVYLHRIKQFRDSPPPPDWNGIERRSHQPEKLDF
ncbi:MAG: adenylate/guanylate cyclase domain-containing protein [Desulfobacterales bacterium]|nr:MAG: adenylate/guanylate cyclase domain-containing protein [Desulfobacterales bacterium]